MRGYVIRNTASLPARESRQAVLIELNGHGVRYGFSDADIHARLLGFGFHSMRYEPFTRRSVALDEYTTRGNTLYVRPSEALEERLREAQSARVLGDAV